MTPDLFLVTAYCAGTICGALGTTTFTGTQALAGYTAACDPAVLPLGSFFVVEGVPSRGPLGWRCEDIGSGIQGRHVDLFLGSLAEAGAFGSRVRRVRVLSTPARPAPVLPWGKPGCPGEHLDEGGAVAAPTQSAILTDQVRACPKCGHAQLSRQAPSPGSLFLTVRLLFWVAAGCWLVALVRKAVQLVLGR